MELLHGITINSFFMAIERFGNTWWGQQWLQALTRIDYTNRLPRGQTYARKGMVEEFQLKDGVIRSSVQGSRPRPYQVTLAMSPFEPGDVEHLIDEITNYPTILSRLLNGKMDPVLMEVARDMGLNLFPRTSSDMEMECSCPDWAVPCKHIAAVVYKFAHEIDLNPFVLFQFRNIDLIQMLKDRGVSVFDANFQNVRQYSDFIQQHSVVNREEYRVLHTDFSRLKNREKEYLNLLEDQPAFYPYGDFKSFYSASLRKIAKLADKVLREKTELDDLLREPNSGDSINYDTILRYDVDQNFQLTSPPFCTIWNLNPDQLNLHHPSVAHTRHLLLIALYSLANSLVTPRILQHKKNYVVVWSPSQLDEELTGIIDKVPEYCALEFSGFRTQGNTLALLSAIITHLIRSFHSFAQKTSDPFIELIFEGQSRQSPDWGESAIAHAISRWWSLYSFDLGTVYPIFRVEETPNDEFDIDIQIGRKGKSLENPITYSEFIANSGGRSDLYDFYKDLDLLSVYMPEIGTYINDKGKSPMVFTSDSLPLFLFDIRPVMGLLGVKVVLPRSMKHLIRPKLTGRVSSSSSESSGLLSISKLLDFDWRISLGNEVVSIDEFQAIAQKAGSLIKYKGQYIFMNESDLARLQKEIVNPRKLSNLETLQIVLAEEYMGTPIVLTDAVKELIRKLTTIELLAPPVELRADFRDYQHRGYSWLVKNLKIGIGSIIADDMGLGKTLQVIALLQAMYDEGYFSQQKAIIVVPTSLISNWESEFEKFAPELKVHTFYGSKRKMEDIQEESIILTSYGVVRSDVERLKKQKWSICVIDEAQNIKNPSSKQAKAVKSLKSGHSVAMSGTPVENRLLDYWSVMDFTNKGLLGSQSKFIKEIANPITRKGDKHVLERFKKITGPFLLRRMKTDRSIISDLPDKIENDRFASLTLEQSALYQQVLDESMAIIQSQSGDDSKSLFKRQGLVLQMILALKQICNHPGQWLKDGRTDADASGKLALLLDTVQPILDSGEKALIFTQFKSMGDIIQSSFYEKFGFQPLWLHGGTSLKDRKKVVEDFQQLSNKKILILSLKAGGTGLNLTAANHVIHYDLWWNPAVEAQATDRAFRIGQNKNVFVHRFITKNTFEEKINRLIQSKKDLAELTVSTGENWIGRMSNRELKEVFEMGN